MGKIVSLKYRANKYKTERWLQKTYNIDVEQYARLSAEEGVRALSNATPRDTGLTADSWNYKVEVDKDKGKVTIVWTNSNVIDEWFNVALMLQYGHGTRNGTWVEGIDYINPALRSVFDELANNLWKEVTEG